MRTLALVAAFAAMISVFSGTDAPAKTKSPIQSVIERQISAFQRNDAQGAFQFASPGIQRRFGSPERFLKMVESGYPQIRRAQRIEFLEAAPHGRLIMQKVLVEGADGLFATAVYALIKIDGKWRIDGVWLLKDGSNV